MGRGVCCQRDALLPSPADLPPSTCFVVEESAHVLQVDPAVRRGTEFRSAPQPGRPRPPTQVAGRATLTLTRTPQDLPTNCLRSRRRVIPCSSCSRGPSLALVIGAAAASRTQRTELQHIQGQRHTRASAVVVRVDEHRAPCAIIWAGACSIYVKQHAASASAATMIVIVMRSCNCKQVE